MKHILILIATAGLAFAQTVEVKDPSTVLVDGVNFGKVADTIANNHKANPQLASKIQVAFEKWYAEYTAAESARISARVADGIAAANKRADDAINTTLANAAKDVAAAKAEYQAAVTATQKEAARTIAAAEAAVTAAKKEAGEIIAAAEEAQKKAHAERQAAWKEKRLARQQVIAVSTAAKLGNKEVLEAELAAAKRDVAAEEKRVLDFQRQQLDKAEAELKAK